MARNEKPEWMSAEEWEAYLYDVAYERGRGNFIS